ncbi:MAG: trypsin-like peptidase domain-containing protein [Verrucomicrobia bacterium]|nr:trypsin-like peptidase domain-containing protein [Verrucomicrobiota bacterium]
MKPHHLFVLAPALLLAAQLHAAPAHPAEPDPRRDASVEAIEKVLPSVVNIATTELRQISDPFEALLREMRGMGRVEKNTSIGSGVIIDEAGYLITNDHVVRRATEIWVKLSDGRERQADRVVTTGRSDVALLKIRARSGEKFTPVKFAPDDDLILGETVLALGNPFGLGGSVSKGILSSKNRRPPPEAEPLGPGDWLQTDAAINPGSSGGPLINVRAELIGINVGLYREGQGIGFALPIKIITDSLAGIFTPERTRGLWFGGYVKAVAKTNGNGATVAGPLTIVGVEPGSPAEQAGLREKDEILRVNNRPVRSFIEFNTELTAAAGKSPASVEVSREGVARTANVRLIVQKEFFTPEFIRGKIGATLTEVTPQMAAELGLNRADGFLITDVDKEGPSADAQLQRGLIIRAFNGQTPDDLVEVGRLLLRKKKGEKVELDLIVLRRQANFLISQAGKAELKVR